MAELRGSRSYGSVLTRKPRRPSLVEILCRAWTGALIDWGSAELLPDRNLLTAEAPRCDRGLLVSCSASSLHSRLRSTIFIDMNGLHLCPVKQK
jgi:hypothetical protein